MMNKYKNKILMMMMAFYKKIFRNIAIMILKVKKKNK